MIGGLVALALVGTSPPSRVVYGPDNVVTCTEWTSMRGSTAGDQMRFWLLGFVTGYDFFSPHSDGDIGAGVGASAMLAWADHYCRENPMDNNVQLATALIRELERRKK